MAAVCKSCGGALSEGRRAGICPKCSFEGALGLGGTGGGRPRSIDGYELLHELGRGGMGVVWLARELTLDRLVALKRIAVSDPMLRKRLLREGQASARLRHPNIVAVHAMGGDDGDTFLAMEFIEGGNLEEHLQGRPIAPREAAVIALKIAGALAHAHAAGLLHRDIKPSNILMGLGDEPKLADFGIAAPLAGSGDLTATGTLAGTPAFLAPELLQGAEAAKPASDIYSLGAVLYTCLTGRPPFIGQSSAAVLAQLPEAEPLSPRLFQPGVPRDLETICMKCLEKSPERRYPSAAGLESDLAAFLGGETITARPVGRPERILRQFRRRPAVFLSTGIAALLLLTLAIGGPLAALKLARSERAAQEARAQTEKANSATLERLRESLLARSRATRLAAGRDQRNDALAAATEAARIRTGLDARDEVIAALALPELEMAREFSITRSLGGAIAFDVDHDRYAFEVAPGQITLRRLSDDGLIQAFSGPKGKVWGPLVFSQDGNWLTFRDGDGNDLVWHLGRPEPAFVLPGRPYVLTGRYTFYGRPTAFSPDGTTFASALKDGGISFHALNDGHELRRIPTDSVVTHVSYSPDGRWLAVGSGLRGGGRIGLQILDAASLHAACTLPVDDSYQSVSWAPGSDRILVGADEIQLFSVPGAKRIRRVVDPLTTEVFFGPGGTSILSADNGGLTKLWDLGRVKPILSAALGSQSGIGTSSDGSWVAKEAGNNTVRLFHLETSRVVRALPIASIDMHDNVFSAAVPVIDYSPDGKRIATAVWGEVQLRDASGTIITSAKVGTAGNYCTVRFSREGASLLVSSNELGLVRIPILGAPDGPARLGSPATIDGEPKFFLADLSRDGKRVLLTSVFRGRCKVVRLDGSSPAVSWDLSGSAGATFLHDDREVLANSLDDGPNESLEVRDAATGARLRTLNYKHGAHAHVSADGKWILFGVGDNQSVLLRTEDWSPGPALPAEVQGRGSQAAFSPDGSVVAFGVGESAVLVGTKDGRILAHLRSPQEGTYIPGLAFSPDGDSLALWWENGQLTVWDIKALRTELSARRLDW